MSPAHIRVHPPASVPAAAHVGEGGPVCTAPACALPLAAGPGPVYGASRVPLLPRFRRRGCPMLLFERATSLVSAAAAPSLRGWPGWLEWLFLSHCPS